MIRTVEEINNDIKNIDANQVSDGYHTFKELYEHRIVLFIALAKMMQIHAWEITGKKDLVWRSKAHSDGSVWNGWFILGIYKGKDLQITYHLPDSKWEETSFAQTLTKAPEWDVHSSEDVLERLKQL